MTQKLDYRYSVRAGWQGRPEGPGSIGAKVLATLDSLSGVDPIFANWEVIDAWKKASFPLSAARADIASIIENNVARDDSREPDPIRGYHAVAMAGKFRDPRSVNFRADVGGNFSSTTLLQFGDYGVTPDPAIVVYSTFKAAVLAINAIWRAPWTCAQAFKVDYEKKPLFPGAPLFPYSSFHIPWLAYLSEPLARDLALPLADISTQPTPDGGLLMTATEDRLDPSNPDHLRRARILAEILIARSGHASK